MNNQGIAFSGGKIAGVKAAAGGGLYMACYPEHYDAALVRFAVSIERSSKFKGNASNRWAKEVARSVIAAARRYLISGYGAGKATPPHIRSGEVFNSFYVNLEDTLEFGNTAEHAPHLEFGVRKPGGKGEHTKGVPYQGFGFGYPFLRPAVDENIDPKEYRGSIFKDFVHAQKGAVPYVGPAVSLKGISPIGGLAGGRIGKGMFKPTNISAGSILANPGASVP